MKLDDLVTKVFMRHRLMVLLAEGKTTSTSGWQILDSQRIPTLAKSGLNFQVSR